MIPHKIHYCWFSNDPFPPEVQSCIDSWHRFMPDWQFVLWDSSKVQKIDSVWLQECLKVHKWAFAADFVRLYALCNEGGVYLDTDVEVFQDFSSMLSHSAFIGREWTWHTEQFLNQQYLTSHCMGAEAGNPFITRCLHYYDNRHFIMSDDETLPHALRFNQMLLPQIQCELAMQIGYDPGLHGDSDVVHLPDLCIYPSCYFDPYKLRSCTLSRHLCLGGWKQTECTHATLALSYRIKYKLDLWLKLLINWVWHH